jgi:hypothetical protein
MIALQTAFVSLLCGSFISILCCSGSLQNAPYEGNLNEAVACKLRTLQIGTTYSNALILRTSTGTDALNSLLFADCRPASPSRMTDDVWKETFCTPRYKHLKQNRKLNGSKKQQIKKKLTI